MRGRGVGRRGPGLVGTMARTAVIAGTATAVSGSMQRNAMEKQQAANAAAQDAAELDAIKQQQQIDAAVAAQVAAQQAAAPAAAPAPPPPPAPAAAPAADLTTKLKELADLKAAGVLTDDEFAAAKAKLLG